MRPADEELHRVLAFITYLRQHPRAHVDEVAAWLSISPKEVRRLTEQVTLSGKAPFGPAELIDVWIDHRDHIHLELDQGLGQPLNLSFSEGLALVIALRTAVKSLGEPLGSPARKLQARIEKIFPESESTQIREIASRIDLEEEEDEEPAQPLSILQQALIQKLAVDIEYFTASRNAMSERRVCVYTLVRSDGHWYAVGFDSLSKTIRVFRVDRMKRATLSSEEYSIPRSFRAAEYQSRSGLEPSGPIKAQIRLGSEVNSRQVVMTCDRPETAVRAALEVGPDVEVVEPASARNALKRFCLDALRAYEDPTSNGD